MAKTKTAFITGVTGQDGSYLAEYLLDIGYIVVGLVRRTSMINRDRVDQIENDRFHLVWGDVTDFVSLINAFREWQPDEIYHLAAQSHVGVSFESPIATAEINATSSLVVLEAMRLICPEASFYNAATSELFGGVQGQAPQNEKTPFYPKSPYAVAKAFGFWATVNAREAYGVRASSGILFNHESPRRGHNFVTKKIANSVAAIKLGKQEKLTLGNLDAVRDWGYAPEYIVAMHQMLQLETPEDLVIGTGGATTVRSFVETAFSLVDIPISWEGDGVDEKGVDRKSGKTLIEISAKYMRPAEVETLISDSSLAKTKINWQPKVFGQVLAEVMVRHEIDNAK